MKLTSRTNMFSKSVMDSLAVAVEDGSDERDYKLRKQYESFLSLELIEYYEKEMSGFGVGKIYFNMEKFNDYLRMPIVAPEFFDCSLVTIDGNYTVKPIQSCIENAHLYLKSIPRNY